MIENKAEILKSIGHPVRLEILRLLLKGPSCATIANQNINISQPNMSQHLKALTETGVVDFCKIGTRRCFYLTYPDFIKELITLLDKDYRRVILKKEDLRSDYAANSAE
jgi:ArsR family transcriptional regulator